MEIFIDGIIYHIQKRGGISRYFDEYLLRLHAIDQDVRIKIYCYKNSVGKIVSGEGIDHIQDKKITPNNPISQIFTKRLNNFITKHYWSNIKSGVFHSTYYTSYPNMKIPTVVTVYDMIHEKFPEYYKDKYNKSFIQRKKKSIESADAIICISKNTKNDLLQIYNVNKDKVFVTPLGVDPTFQEISDEQIKNKILIKYNIKKPFLLFVGNRTDYKNFIKFIEAYAAWDKNDKFSVITVGGGKFLKNELTLFEKLNISEKVKNLGYVNNENLMLLYNCTNAFVFPSLYEGFGLPLLEAMSCGTLILASNTSSIPEVAGNCAIYFDPKDKESLINALDKIFDSKKKEEFITKGLKRIKNFTWNNTAKKTLKIYKLLSN